MDDFKRIKINKDEDRLTVAQILIKNGYTVRVVKIKRETGKAYDFFIEYKKED